MSKRNLMGYHGYQGRGGGSSWLKALVIVLALSVVCGGFYLLGRQGGLPMPDWTLLQPSAAPSPQDPGTAVSPGQGEPASDTPNPSPQLPQIRAVEMTVEQLLEGDVQLRLEQADCQAIVVQVKDSSGKLQWPSQVALAKQLGAVSNQQSLTQTLKTLSDQGVYLVARMDCFRDQLLATEDYEGSLLMSQRGRRWYDFFGMSWVSPVSAPVRQYVVQLCQELAQMGFDELVLDSCGFPDQGEVHALAESANYPQQRTTAVEQFWTQLTQALEKEEILLSAQVRGDAVLNGGASSGMTVEMLERFTQRVWVSLGNEAQADVAAQLTQGGIQPQRQMVGHTANNGQKIWSQG